MCTSGGGLPTLWMCATTSMRRWGRVENVFNVAVRVRLDWRMKGEVVAEGTSTGWVGPLVRVHLPEQGVEIWLLADDVQRA